MEGLEKYDEMLANFFYMKVSQTDKKQRTKNCEEMLHYLLVVDKFINN